MVLSADKVRRRISLSLRQLHGGGPTGEGGVYEPPSYDFPEDDEDDEETAAAGDATASDATEIDVTEPAVPADVAGPNGVVASDAGAEAPESDGVPRTVGAPGQDPD